jgi:DNA-binding NtrC family response regulator
MDTNRFLHDLAEQFPLSLTPHARRVLVSGADESLRRLCAEVIRGDNHYVIETADDAVLLEQVRTALLDPVRGRFDVLLRDARTDSAAALGLLACVRRMDKTLPVVLLVKNAERPD